MSTTTQGKESLLMTVAEVAELLGLDTSTVARWALDGLMPAPIRKSKGFVRWLRRDLLDWVEAGLPDAAEWNQSKVAR